VSEPLIDDATFAELRDLETSAMGQLAAIARDGAPIVSRVPFTVIPAVISASGMAIHAAIAGLGGGRASHIGFMPWGTDVIDGDVITSLGRTYAVEGVGLLDTSVGLALSEVGRG
jgi:hypothetical protein